MASRGDGALWLGKRQSNICTVAILYRAEGLSIARSEHRTPPDQKMVDPDHPAAEARQRAAPRSPPSGAFGRRGLAGGPMPLGACATSRPGARISLRVVPDRSRGVPEG